MAAILLCPRDGIGTSLETHRGRVRSFSIDICPRCGGVWYDRGEIGKLTGEHEVERLIVEYAGGRSDFPCPRCGKTMATRPVGAVVVDVCMECHGVWFDADELEEVVRSMAGEVPLPGVGPLSGGYGHWEAMSLAAFASPSKLKTLLQPRRPQIPRPEEL
ncbi:MAG TPA: zf-TFIIB domain-containing protein [Thermoplasmata archaeon]|nr:zf-TFIIB domain-containing protein [Thermoplasmata archaeon]